MDTILLALRGFNEPMEVYLNCQTYEWQGVTFLEVGLVVNKGATKVTIAASKVAQAITDASEFSKDLTDSIVTDHG